MRMAAFAGLAIALVLSAVLLLTGGPQLSSVEASSPLAPSEPAQSQAVDDVQIEMLLNGQPETLFPGEVVSGTTVVVSGTRSIAGRVRYNVRNEQGVPIVRRTTVHVVDPSGIEVRTDTFDTEASYTGYITRNFTVTGDDMFAKYRTLLNTGIPAVKTKTDQLQPTTTGIVSDTLNLVGELVITAGDNVRVLQRVLEFSELVTPTQISLTRALTETQFIVTSADNIARTGTTSLAQCASIIDPGQRAACEQQVNQRINNYNTSLTAWRAAAQVALDRYNAVAESLAGLSNLKIPVISQCGFDTQNRPIPRTYVSNVSQLIVNSEGTQDITRDSWEWQVGTATPFKNMAEIVITPSKFYLLSVAASTVHSATVFAQVYDLKCLPLPDGQPIGFFPTIGQTDPITVTTFSENGEHGLARTTLRPNDNPGNGLVRINGLSGSAVFTIIGPANRLVFLTTSGEQQSSRYLGQGETTQLQVQVLDQNGSIVADGTQVEFTVTNGAGQFGQSIVNTVNGLAQASFTARQTPLASAVVTARAVGTNVSAQLTIAIVGPPSQIQLGVAENYSTTLYINSRSDDYPNFTFVEAVVSDQGGSPVADGTQVEFRLTATNRAFWENPDPSGNGLTTIVTTSGGRARAKLQVPDSDNPVRNTVNVLATVVGDNAPSPAVRSLPLTITLSDALPVIRTEYKIFLPMILDRARCGRAGGGGCTSGAP